MYFLDTNVLTELRYGNNRVIERLRQTVGTVHVSAIVAEEMLAPGFIAEINSIRSGRSKANLQATYTHFVEAIQQLASFSLLPYTAEAEVIYKTFKTARLRGMDGRFAAHALSLGYKVVTRNVRDFVIVPNLTVEDWTA